MKIIKIFIILITAFLYTGSLNQLNASTEPSPLPVKIAADFKKILEAKGWNADTSDDSVNAWSYNPSYQSLKMAIKYQDKDNETFLIIIDSERNGSAAHKAFPFNKKDISNTEKIESFLFPYLISLTNSKIEKDKKSGYYPSVKAGYYRTNENSEIFPEKSEGMLFLGWNLTYDPLKDAGNSSIPLYIGDYMDSSFNLSVNREKEKFFGKLDEFTFDIDIILYGRSNKKASGERNMYGLFTGVEYYRPFLKGSSVLWNDDVYTDHNHIQYCYWETVAFIQNLTFSNGGRDLSLRYEIGAGPGQNSSLTATSITEDQEKDLNPIFTSNWYGLNDLGARRHNYYYSMTFPVKLEISADRYLNSKIELKYHFYYFQSIKDKKAQDFLNRIIFNYGYYITENITAGFGYEFWHVKGIENDNNKSHYWNRLNIQMEMKI